LGDTVFEDVRKTLGPRLERIVAFAGMELVHCEARRESGGTVLRLYIDREGGVTLDDCARISRQVSAELDADDPIEGRYTLEVSSPGLDRPLSRDRDFERFVGSQVRVVTASPLDGQRHFKGRLNGLLHGAVQLVLEDGREVSIPRDLMTSARLDAAWPQAGGAATKGRHA
jgi:ribosome maturation factor RimP